MAGAAGVYLCSLYQEAQTVCKDIGSASTSTKVVSLPREYHKLFVWTLNRTTLPPVLVGEAMILRITSNTLLYESSLYPKVPTRHKQPPGITCPSLKRVMLLLVSYRAGVERVQIRTSPSALYAKNGTKARHGCLGDGAITEQVCRFRLWLEQCSERASWVVRVLLVFSRFDQRCTSVF